MAKPNTTYTSTTFQSLAFVKAGVYVFYMSDIDENQSNTGNATRIYIVKNFAGKWEARITPLLLPSHRPLATHKTKALSISWCEKYHKHTANKH